MYTSYTPASSRDLLRPARLSDIEFVLTLAIEGAESGNYSCDLLQDEVAYNFKKSLEQVIMDGGLVRLEDNKRIPLFAKLYLLENRVTGRNEGFLLATEKYPGAGNREIEIYMMSVAKDLVGSGCGSKMVRLFQRTCLPGSRLYVRCYENSCAMRTLLRKSGFSERRMNVKWLFEYEYKKLEVPIYNFGYLGHYTSLVKPSPRQLVAYI